MDAVLWKAAPSSETKFELKDTASNILASAVSALTRGLTNNNTVIVKDESITDDEATKLRTHDAANNPDSTTGLGGFQVAGSSSVGNFPIKDTSANLLLDANKDAVAASTSITVTDKLSVADITKVVNKTNANSTVKYSLTDNLGELSVSYTHLTLPTKRIV